MCKAHCLLPLSRWGHQFAASGPRCHWLAATCPTPAPRSMGRRRPWQREPRRSSLLFLWIQGRRCISSDRRRSTLTRRRQGPAATASQGAVRVQLCDGWEDDHRRRSSEEASEARDPLFTMAAPEVPVRHHTPPEITRGELQEVVCF
jgi:hypothetical protein